MSNPVRFLSRWSRLKRQAVAEAPAVPVVVSGLAVPESTVDQTVAPIDPGTDLSALLREELSDAVRKQALKAIFADPHFNVMDGLDTYIDDYSISEPIPPEMLATLNQARFLFEADEVQGETLAEAPETGAREDGQAENCDNLNRCGQKVAVASFPESIEKEK